MPTPIVPFTLADLTDTTLEGSGVFDVLMRANKAHLESEFNKNRIKGPEYSSVYLGSLTQVLSTALQFLSIKDKNALEAQLLEQQILLAQQEVLKATATVAQIIAQTALVTQQKLNAVAELAIIQANALKATAEIAQIEAQTLMIGQQKINLTAEKLLTDSKVTQTAQQTANLLAEVANIPKQGLLIEANKAQVTQQTDNLLTQKAQVAQETALLSQRTTNAVTEGLVLTAQKCKLDAEFDVLMETKLKTAQETSLLLQKVSTEKAQTTALGVDDNSVVGKQKLLYQAQTTGFNRDAEQKAAKLLVDSWSTRRATDEATQANTTNMLDDSAVGRAVNKLLAGVGA